jgi:hypothetical protein
VAELYANGIIGHPFTNGVRRRRRRLHERPLLSETL